MPLIYILIITLKQISKAKKEEEKLTELIKMS